MPIIQFDAKSLLRDKLVDPGAWYRVVIDSVGEWTNSKDGNSQNLLMEGTILFNGDTGDTKFQGVPIGGMGVWNYNTKALGFMLGLVKALAPQIGVDPDTITEKTRFEAKAFEGKQVDLWIINDTYEGRIKNKVEHKYRAPKAEVTAKVA